MLMTAIRTHPPTTGLWIGSQRVRDDRLQRAGGTKPDVRE